MNTCGNAECPSIGAALRARGVAATGHRYPVALWSTSSTQRAAEQLGDFGIARGAAVSGTIAAQAGTTIPHSALSKELVMHVRRRRTVLRAICAGDSWPRALDHAIYTFRQNEAEFWSGLRQCSHGQLDRRLMLDASGCLFHCRRREGDCSRSHRETATTQSSNRCTYVLPDGSIHRPTERQYSLTAAAERETDRVVKEKLCHSFGFRHGAQIDRANSQGVDLRATRRKPNVSVAMKCCSSQSHWLGFAALLSKSCVTWTSAWFCTLCRAVGGTAM